MLLVWLSLLALLTDAQSTTCTQQKTCASATTTPNCGWCWDATTTVGQLHGARPGNADGPMDGYPCNDWASNQFLGCYKHTDCPSLPDCLNILGTYCGWCIERETAFKGNASGPFAPYTCDASSWVTDTAKCPPTHGPEQIHIALTADPNSIIVTWSTSKNVSGAVVYWQHQDGTSPTRHIAKSNTTYFGPAQHNPDGKQWIHRAVMTGLAAESEYEYYVESGDMSSESFVFRTLPNVTDYVGRFLVYGDMGRHGGGYVLRNLEKEALSQQYHSIIHIGDFAYDLDNSGGLNGDTFMNRIQNIAAQIPYMTCPGNHENGDSWDHYKQRFSMPGWYNHGGNYSWFSFDIQKVHFISYSSEVFFDRPWDIVAQRDWLLADLAEANKPENRAARPWIVAFGHRPMYCSNSDGDDCTTMNSRVRLGLEDIFHAGGVDLVIEAHEHSYERLWPVYNGTVTEKSYVDPTAMVHLITGTAGCNENDGACVNPMKKPPYGEWSAFRAGYEGDYAYMHLEVHNDTHLYFDNYLTEMNSVNDAGWIVQHNHGPRYF